MHKQFWYGLISLTISSVALYGYQVEGDTVTLDPAEDWSKDDNTKLIQQLLNHSDPVYKKIIIPPGPDLASWKISPLQIRHDGTHILLKEDAILEATPGAYPRPGDSVFNANHLKGIALLGEKNSKIIMQKAEYATQEPSEWKMIVSLRDCEDVTIRGLTMVGAGGDAIYIGGGYVGYCKDIVIDSVVIDDASRNGISVISVRNFTLKNSTIRNTRGTGSLAARGPWAGIDFEANSAADYLENVLIDNCTFSNNHGYNLVVSGWSMSKIKKDVQGNDIPSASVPISIMVRNSTFDGSPYDGSIQGLTHHGFTFTGMGVGLFMLPAMKGPDASIVFEDCMIRNHDQYGIAIHNRAAEFGAVRFIRCTLENNGKIKGGAPIYIGTVGFPIQEHGGNVIFEDVSVVASEEKRGQAALLLDTRLVPISDVTGTIRTTGGTVSRTGSHPTKNIGVKFENVR